MNIGLTCPILTAGSQEHGNYVPLTHSTVLLGKAFDGDDYKENGI